ncbi:MAG: restriction endonuclease, partial [Gemmobacter sp.]
AFGKIDYSVQGVPNDLESARQFFEANDPTKKEFEKWAVGLVAFMPQDKKGADGGFDGAEWFGPSKEFKALVSVKGGKRISVKDVREFDSVLSAKGAKAGIFLTLERPTRDMVQWAKKAGTCEVPGFPSANRIQIVSIEDAMRLGPQAVNLPARHTDTYRSARRESGGPQGAFEL